MYASNLSAIKKNNVVVEFDTSNQPSAWFQILRKRESTRDGKRRRQLGEADPERRHRKGEIWEEAFKKTYHSAEKKSEAQVMRDLTRCSASFIKHKNLYGIINANLIKKRFLLKQEELEMMAKN